MRNLPYLFLTGLRNIFKHPGSSLLSLLIMIFTIFLFEATYATLVNIRSLVDRAESSVGITVFFDEGLTEKEILSVGEKIGRDERIAKMEFTSAEQAWETFKEIYFQGNEELANGFIEDNPLANSASYEIFLVDIRDQQDFVEYLEGVDGVRRVNFSNVAAEGLGNIGDIVQWVSLGVLAVLLFVSVILISNSISLTLALRKEEVHVMRYLGATNAFIRLPFLIEGGLIGLFGAALPTLGMYYAYDEAVVNLRYKLKVFGDFVEFLPKMQVFRILIPIALVLGVGIGLLGSFFSIRKHLRV